MDDHTASVSCPRSSNSFCKCRLRTEKLPDSVFCKKTLAAIGSIPGDALPAMIEIDAVGASDILLENRSITPYSCASGQAPRSIASATEAASAWLRICLNIRLFQDFATTLSQGTIIDCRKPWNPMTPSPTERSRIAEYRAFSMPSGARSMKSCSTLSRNRMISSTNVGWFSHANQFSRFSEARQQTAVRSLP